MRRVQAIQRPHLLLHSGAPETTLGHAPAGLRRQSRGLPVADRHRRPAGPALPSPAGDRCRRQKVCAMSAAVWRRSMPCAAPGASAARHGRHVWRRGLSAVLPLRRMRRAIHGLERRRGRRRTDHQWTQVLLQRRARRVAPRTLGRTTHRAQHGAPLIGPRAPARHRRAPRGRRHSHHQCAPRRGIQPRRRRAAAQGAPPPRVPAAGGRALRRGAPHPRPDTQCQEAAHAELRRRLRLSRDAAQAARGHHSLPAPRGHRRSGPESGDRWHVSGGQETPRVRLVQVVGGGAFVRRKLPGERGPSPVGRLGVVEDLGAQPSESRPAGSLRALSTRLSGLPLHAVAASPRPRHPTPGGQHHQLQSERTGKAVASKPSHGGESRPPTRRDAH
mmetsp:Transcript_16927/g.41757  ORF Transcript_16927/g.41757 Transcript_16927/m.41757 type:complete len:388 (+) Transcript_16927:159-1322(+)